MSNFNIFFLREWSNCDEWQWINSTLKDMLIFCMEDLPKPELRCQSHIEHFSITAHNHNVYSYVDSVSTILEWLFVRSFGQGILGLEEQLRRLRKVLWITVKGLSSTRDVHSESECTWAVLAICLLLQREFSFEMERRIFSASKCFLSQYILHNCWGTGPLHNTYIFSSLIKYLLLLLFAKLCQRQLNFFVRAETLCHTGR